MKEYLHIMKEEQKQLRKQIADCLRYIKNLNTGRFGYGWIQRKDIEVHEDTIDTTHSGVSLETLVEYVDPKYYSNVFVRGKSYEDYDGQDGSEVELYTLRKQTDQEYFDYLCSYIVPIEYQQNQYETYLRLKKLFEANIS